MNQIIRNILIWASSIVLAGVVYTGIYGNEGRFNSAGGKDIPYSQFMGDAKDGKISSVTIVGQKMTGHFSDGGDVFSVQIPPNENVVDRLKDTSVTINAKPVDDGSMGIFGTLAMNIFLTVIFLGGWFLLMRYMQGKSGGGGGGGAMGFGRSRAKMLTEGQGTATFNDVAGIEEAKEELEEIVDFLKDPQSYQKLGGKIPRGALLVGSPGTGKTLIARAVAGEAGVPFFSISGSDFVEMFVGVGASRVRDMFEQGKRNAPCIIFIDEIDAVGRQRGGNGYGGHDEREQTLNQLLVEMDGFSDNEGVIILAATNRPDVLDKALLRPGRFDRQINVPLPDIIGRAAILKVHTKNVPIAGDVDLQVIARGTPGFAGAELANLINEAALLAAKRSRRVVSMVELEDAKDKVMMGAERRSMVMTEDEKNLTAYHEAGHALVAINEPASDPIHKATIVPRGRALGLVMRLPERDRISVSREKLYADLAVAMGGRVAEEVIFGYDKVTTGASSDIQQATSIARNMVMSWGLSDKLGPLDYTPDENGSPFGAQSNVSNKTSQAIDDEVKEIVEASYKRAKSIIEDKIDDLHKVAKSLLEYEMLSGDEIRLILDGQAILRESPNADLGDAGVEDSLLPVTSVADKDVAEDKKD